MATTGVLRAEPSVSIKGSTREQAGPPQATTECAQMGAQREPMLGRRLVKAEAAVSGSSDVKIAFSALGLSTPFSSSLMFLPMPTMPRIVASMPYRFSSTP